MNSINVTSSQAGMRPPSTGQRSPAGGSDPLSQLKAKVFAKVDSNSDGGVDKAELQTMLSKVGEKTGLQLSNNADQAFSKMDGNGDGKLNSDELGKGIQALAQALTPSTVSFAQSRSSATSASNNSNSTNNVAAAGQGPRDGKDLFAKVDTNGDGSIDAAESQVLSDKVKSETGKDTSDMFAKLDKDGDGKLSKTEFDAGKPPRPPQGAGGPQGAQGGPQGGPQGAGGPPPAGGPREGAGKTKGSSSASSGSFDPLDTNQDGTVSELERLVAQISTAASSSSSSSSNSSGSGSANTSSSSSSATDNGNQARSTSLHDNANSKFNQFVQQLYQQISASYANSSSVSLSA